MFFLEKENGKNQDSVFLVILGKQGNTEIYYLGKAILRENTILLYIENTHEFGKKEADEIILTPGSIYGNGISAIRHVTFITFYYYEKILFR